jgi:TP901 family phage tail tape measure protein
MSRFVLTAQLQLQAPNNVAQVVRQIQSQLNNVTVNVQVQNAQQAQRQLQQVTNQTNQATSAASKMGKAFAVSVRRFAAFSIATRAVGLFTSTLSDAVQTAIDFERELIKISQVTGKSVNKLRDLTNTITSLSTSFGVSSNSLLEVSTVLAQAGLQSEDTAVALKTLAKAALAPNFDSITETAEGAIAILAQFKQGVGALEGQLGSINAVAGAFAVEASDLIDVVRRTGGVFKSSGGSLNELLALFTSVRATTRESAESIGTGLRTIFTRIQRPKTIEFLKQFGVELVDLEGKFVGPYEAIRRLSGALSGLGEGDLTFISIAEELGGFRQIGKVLPLLQQFATAEAALNVATKANNSLSQDAISAQAALAIRITKVKEEFLALVRSITETSTFQIMANTALSLASALIKIADAIKPLIPLLAAVAGFKIAKGLGSFAGSVAKGFGFNKGGKVHAFASGGLVPGTGNRDTVPAMLSPGEFVIRKSSVNKLGASNLAAMNENKYAAGGLVNINRAAYGSTVPASIYKRAKGQFSESAWRKMSQDERDQAAASLANKMSQRQKTSKKDADKLAKDRKKTLDKYPGGAFTTRPKSIGGFFLTPEMGTDGKYSLPTDRVFELNGQKAAILQGSTIENYVPFRGDLAKNSAINNIVDSNAQKGISDAVTNASNQISNLLDTSQIAIDQNRIEKAAAKSASDKQVYSTLGGYMYEGIIQGLTGSKLSGGQIDFDFNSLTGNNKKSLSSFFGRNESEFAGLIKADAKRALNSKMNSSIFDKVANSITKGDMRGVKKLGELRQTKKYFGGLIQKFAAGGMAQAPLIDDIINASGTVMPRPSSAIAALIKAGGGAIDIDRTLKRTIGDKAYGMARTAGQQSAALEKYFRDPNARLKDVTSAPLTVFGKELQTAIKSGQLQPGKLSIISKSQRVPGVAEYLSKLFGIPLANMIFTQGGSKQPAMDALRAKGPRSTRVARFATGGGVGTDTVPALLTPGEFVINKKSAQSIGYGALGRMNKVGKYANGGVVQYFGSGSSNTGVKPSPAASTGGSLAAWNQFFNNNTKAVASNTQSVTSNTGSVNDLTGNNNLLASSIMTTVPGLIQGFLPAINESSSGLARVTDYFLGLSTTLAGVTLALQAFGVSLSAEKIMKLFGTGAGGIGSIVKNAFSGFKMGAAGISGPQPLGGGIASSAGRMFGTGKAFIGSKLSKANEFINKNLQLPQISGSSTLGRIGRSASSGFSQGMRGMPGAQAYFGKGASPFMKNLSIGATKAGGLAGRLAGSVTSGPIGRGFGNLRAGIGVGMNQGFGATQLVRNIAGARGLAGSAGQFIGGAARAGGAIASGLGSAAGGVGSAALTAAGPIAAITGLVAIVNGAVGAFRNLDGQLQKSIQAGKIEEASRLAAAKAAADFPLIGNLISGWSSDFDDLIVSAGIIFGGSTLDSVKALAASQAGAVKTQKQLEQAQKTATIAMEDFQNGSITASEALSKIRAASSEVANQEKRSGDFAIKNLENRASGGFTGRNIASFFTGGMVESSATRNERLGKQSSEQINQSAKFQAEAFQMETAARTANIRSGFARGVDPNEIRREATGDLQKRLSQQRLLGNQLQASGDQEGADAAFEAAKQLAEQLKQVDREMVNLEKEVARTKAAFEAMNLGLRGPEATASALSASMTRFAAGLEVGGNQFVANTEFLSSAMSSAAQAMDPAEIKSAIKNVKDNLLEMGISPENAAKFEANTNAFVKAQQNYTKAFENIRSRSKDKKLTPDELKDEFAKELTAGLGGDAKKNLEAIIKNMELSPTEVDQILSGNLQAFGDKLTEAGRKQFEAIRQISQEREKAEQVIINLTKSRIEAERNLVEAQKEALDLYSEGRDVQAKFGGAAVTPAERRNVLLAKSNIETNRLGMNQLKSGSVEELRARNKELMGSFSAIEAQRRTGGGMEKVAGVSADEAQKDIQKAYKSQIETIRNLIKLEEEELKIIQEKNKLEKQSLESLISGDIEKFFEQQAGVGAQAAIATGNESLMNAFGGQALSTAFTDLQRQQEAGVTTAFGQQIGGAGGLLERGASAALAARGVQNPLMAQRLAGTTPEEEAQKAKLRGLGGVLAETGQVGIDMAQMQLNTAEINVSQANIKMQEIIDRGNAAAAGMARGGIVYASRGMFVPRGTDTVPAMLTPGEFVVNRAAVNRGNNLQLLQAINGNTASSPKSNVTQALARGGRVQYLADGGIAGFIQNMIGPDIFSGLIKSLTAFGSQMAENIKSLNDTKFKITLDTTNINVNLNGGSFLSSMKEEIKQQLMSEISKEIQNYGTGPGNKLTKNQSTLPSVRT